MSENVNTNFDDDLEKLDEVNEELNVKKDSDNQNKVDEEGLSEEEKKQAEKLRRLREVENRISTDKSKLERDDKLKVIIDLVFIQIVVTKNLQKIMIVSIIILVE